MCFVDQKSQVTSGKMPKLQQLPLGEITLARNVFIKKKALWVQISMGNFASICVLSTFAVKSMSFTIFCQNIAEFVHNVEFFKLITNCVTHSRELCLPSPVLDLDILFTAIWYCCCYFLYKDLYKFINLRKICEV